MSNTTQGTEDHATLSDAIRSLTDRGFEKASPIDNHYRHPDRMDDGFWQRADAYRPYNMTIGRISFWPGIA